MTCYSVDSQLTIRHMDGGVKTRLRAPVASLTAAKRWLRLRYPWHRVVALKRIKLTAADRAEYRRCGGL